MSLETENEEYNVDVAEELKTFIYRYSHLMIFQCEPHVWLDMKRTGSQVPPAHSEEYHRTPTAHHIWPVVIIFIAASGGV
jgi:hypothetical protein